MTARTQEDFERIFRPISVVRDAYDLTAHQVAETVTESLQELLVAHATLLATFDNLTVYALWRDGAYTPENEDESQALVDIENLLNDENNQEVRDAAIERFRVHLSLRRGVDENPQMNINNPKTEAEIESRNASKVIELGGAEHGKALVEEQLRKMQSTMDGIIRTGGPEPHLVPGGQA